MHDHGTLMRDEAPALCHQRLWLIEQVPPLRDRVASAFSQTAALISAASRLIGREGGPMRQRTPVIGRVG